MGSSSESESTGGESSSQFDSPETLLKLTRKKQKSGDYPVWEGPVDNLQSKAKITDVTDRIYRCGETTKLKKDVRHETVDEKISRFSSRQYRELPITDPDGFPERTDYYSTDRNQYTCGGCDGEPTTCETCRGNGFKPCYNCEAGKVEVKVDCDDCGGTGEEPKGPCQRCGGDGDITESVSCPECGGKGTKTRKVTCPTCQGNGVLKNGDDCPECSGFLLGGTGKKKITDECSKCMGDKTIRKEKTCRRCGGSGKRTGPCSRCNGDKKIEKEQECDRCNGHNRLNCKCVEGKYCPNCKGYGQRIEHLLITVTYSTETQFEHSPKEPPHVSSSPTRLWDTEEETITELNDSDQYVRQRQAGHSLPTREVTYQYEGEEYKTYQSGGNIYFENAPVKKTTKEDLSSNLRSDKAHTLKQAGYGIIGIFGYLILLLLTLTRESIIVQLVLGLATLGLVFHLVQQPKETLSGAIFWIVISAVMAVTSSAQSLNTGEWMYLTAVICVPVGIAVSIKYGRAIGDSLKPMNRNSG